MANRKDWYYEQLVLEGELDEAFEGLELADWALVKDYGIGRDDSNGGEFGGILWGLSAVFNSGLNIQVYQGAAYDSTGRRIGHKDTAVSPNDYTVITVEETGSTDIGQGGVPTGGVSTDPGVGNERWVSIFIVFDRLLSDPRYDGYDNRVYLDRDESWHFEVTMGAAKTIGTSTDTDKPPRQDGKLLVTDVRIKNSTGTVLYDVLDGSRKEVWFNVTATGSGAKQLSASTPRAALKAFLQYYSDHIGGDADKHPASDVDYTGGQVWADGTGGATGAAANLQDAIDGIVTDLRETAALPDGTSRIGGAAQTGSLTAPSSSSPVSLGAGRLYAQLLELLNAVNGRVFRGGDDGIAGALSPAVDGTDLGTASKSWDALLRDITVKGSVKSDLIPDGDIARDLGAPTLRWTGVWAYEGAFDHGLSIGSVAGYKPLVAYDTGEMLWGRSGSYPSGRAAARSDGRFDFLNGILFQPASGPTAPYMTWDPVNRPAPTSPMKVFKAPKASGVVDGDGFLSAFGLRHDGYAFFDDFSDIKPGYNLLTVPDIPNARYGGGGVSITRNFGSPAGTFNALDLITAGTTGSIAHLSGPGLWSTYAGVWLYVRIIPDELTSMGCFVGLTSTTEAALPFFSIGGQNLLGLYYSSLYAGDYKILASDSGGASALGSTGITPTTGVPIDFYMHCDSSMNINWWTQSTGWQLLTAPAVSLNSVSLHLYAHLVTLANASKSFELCEWAGKRIRQIT